MQASSYRSIPLETGDPAGDSPASFTRFVLPFSWSLDPTAREGEQGGCVYVRDDSSISSDRRKYFTPETARALYERAFWLKLAGSGDGPAGTFTFHVGEKAIAVEIAQPRLVLFEANVKKRKRSVTGTGFLLVDISFSAPQKQEQAPTLDDLLVINERFRYWRCPWDGHLTDTARTPSGDASYQTLLSDLRSTGCTGNPYFDWWEKLLKYPVEIKGARFQLVSSDALRNSKQWIDSGNGNPGWIAYTDDRAFVWTCALTKDGCKGVSSLRTPEPTHSSEWIRLLNVDAMNDEPSPFERTWADERTYARWKHTGTLYGFTMHSGAMLGAPVPGLPTWQHFRELYFDQLLMLFYLRVSIFRFKAKLAEISDELNHHLRGKAIDDFRSLRAAFASLTNLYRFPLLSSQQQGIEMYASMRSALDIEEFFREIQEEIKATHEMFELLTTSRMSEATALLTIGAVVLGLLATVMTFLAVKDLERYVSPREQVLKVFDHVPWVLPSVALILFSLIVSLIFAAVLAYRWFWRSSNAGLRR
jgi:hypothetical protein